MVSFLPSFVYHTRLVGDDDRFGSVHCERRYDSRFGGFKGLYQSIRFQCCHHIHSLWLGCCVDGIIHVFSTISEELGQGSHGFIAMFGFRRILGFLCGYGMYYDLAVRLASSGGRRSVAGRFGCDKDLIG